MRAIRPSPRTRPSSSESMLVASSRCRRAETISCGIGDRRGRSPSNSPHPNALPPTSAFARDRDALCGRGSPPVAWHYLCLNSSRTRFLAYADYEWLPAGCVGPKKAVPLRPGTTGSTRHTFGDNDFITLFLLQGVKRTEHFLNSTEARSNRDQLRPGRVPSGGSPKSLFESSILERALPGPYRLPPSIRQPHGSVSPISHRTQRNFRDRLRELNRASPQSHHPET
jgi:hypothetical protein